MVDVARLTDALSGLCEARQQAATSPAAAKATYGRRSEYGVDTTTRALRSSYSVLAAAMSKAGERVKADLATEPPAPTLADDLAGLTETMRRGLAALGIPTQACP